MRLPTARLRIIVRHAAEVGQIVALSVVSVVVLYRLGNMQLEGLVTFAGGSAGLLFAFTSLQNNRARAYQVGPSQRRSLIVAELALRATLAFTSGAIVTATLYFLLSESGYQPSPWNRRPNLAVPALLAFIPLAFFAHTVCVLSRATRVLLHGMVVPLSVRRLTSGR